MPRAIAFSRDSICQRPGARSAPRTASQVRENTAFPRRSDALNCDTSLDNFVGRTPSRSTPRLLWYALAMVRRSKPTGPCRICGDVGPLTYEHVPPRAAFNNRRVVVATGDNAMELGPYPPARGTILQRGVGAYTLCGRCNNSTGRWYAPAFIEWCYQGMHVLIRSGGRPSLVYLNYLLPLRIIKQIITMFFSVNGERFAASHPELVQFVMDKERRYLNPKYRVFAYYNTAETGRRVGIAGRLDLKTRQVIVMSEISFVPFGYLLTLGSEPPDQRLLEITHFARYGYDEFEVAELRIPVLQTHLAIPGDYRTREEILKQAAFSKASGGRSGQGITDTIKGEPK